MAAGERTPREIQRAVTAAAQGQRRRLADAITAAFVGARSEPAQVQRLVRELTTDGAPAPLPPEAQAAALTALANRLGTISLAEFRARLRAKQ